MNIAVIYTASISVSLVLGFLLTQDFYGIGDLIEKKKKVLITGIQDRSGDAVFKNAGINLSLKRYKAVRDTLLMVLFVIAFAMFAGGVYSILIKTIVAGVILYLMTLPKEHVFGRRTPFKAILDLLRKNYLESKDLELMSVISQMKNLSISNKDKPMSAVFMLKDLMRFTKTTKPVFAKTVSLLMRDGPKGASRYFADAFGTKLGKNFAAVILKLDDLNPTEFTAQLELFQISIREIKKTRKTKRQENEANLMFVLASLQVLFITMNFIMMVMSSIPY